MYLVLKILSKKSRKVSSTVLKILIKKMYESIKYCTQYPVSDQSDWVYI